MTNYLAQLWVAVLFAGAGAATATAAELSAAKPAAAGASVSAAPAGTSSNATAPRFTQAPGGSLTFTFMQAGAESRGSFRQFATELGYDEKNPAAGSLKVTVQIASLDTQDKDRDDALGGADLFDAKKYPTAHYVASSFAKRADGGLEAVGKLTLRGVTRDLRVPLRIQTAVGGVELSGEVTISRLDFGVGQGEWKSTEWVGDDVKLQYKVPLSRSK
jgi:polyisoprenoid-binding protein YceI